MSADRNSHPRPTRIRVLSAPLDALGGGPDLRDPGLGWASHLRRRWHHAVVLQAQGAGHRHLRRGVELHSRQEIVLQIQRLDRRVQQLLYECLRHLPGEPVVVQVQPLRRRQSRRYRPGKLVVAEIHCGDRHRSLRPHLAGEHVALEVEFIQREGEDGRGDGSGQLVHAEVEVIEPAKLREDPLHCAAEPVPGEGEVLQRRRQSRDHPREIIVLEVQSHQRRRGERGELTGEVVMGEDEIEQGGHGRELVRDGPRELVEAHVEGAEPNQRAYRRGDGPREEVTAETKELEVGELCEGVGERADDSAGGEGELLERREAAHGGVEAACEAGGAGAGLAERERHHAVAGAAHAGEAAGVGSEVPGGEEAGARYVVEGLADGLQREEVSGVEDRRRGRGSCGEEEKRDEADRHRRSFGRLRLLVRRAQLLLLPLKNRVWRGREREERPFPLAGTSIPW